MMSAYGMKKLHHNKQILQRNVSKHVIVGIKQTKR